MIIEGAKNKLTKVLKIVLTNSIKNSNKEERKITAETVISKYNAKIIIADNGSGINPSNIRKIFEQFESIPTKYDVTGTGIGLYIAREIISTHQGTINIYSERKDKGVRVTIQLPRI
ncbi:MAG: sensor histidine kinase [Candidatus Hodarchaeota archaeon]